MEFTDWEPVYAAILADFGYGRAGDEAARDDLAGLVADADATPLGDAALTWLAGATVAVAGGAPCLRGEDDLERARAPDVDAVIAASTAADVLREAGVDVDLMVTDLDKNPATAAALTRDGTPVAVHAHGDNRDLVREWVPQCDLASVLPTTQAAPVGPVVNPGGFTDGDRAAFLADHCGAAELRFVGWDVDDPSVDAGKRRKLRWAERLLAWLEARRGERFDVLEGRRDGIEPVPDV
jgi:uncharacterized Rossmann fold enzyme